MKFLHLQVNASHLPCQDHFLLSLSLKRNKCIAAEIVVTVTKAFLKLKLEGRTFFKRFRISRMLKQRQEIVFKFVQIRILFIFSPSQKKKRRKNSNEKLKKLKFYKKFSFWREGMNLSSHDFIFFCLQGNSFQKERLAIPPQNRSPSFIQVVTEEPKKKEKSKKKVKVSANVKAAKKN